MNQNIFDNINAAIEKIAEYKGMTAEQKSEYSQTLSNGFLNSILADSKDLISKENLDKINTLSPSQPDPSQQKLIIEATLKEISESEKGEAIVDENINKLLDVIFLPLKDLTEEQKEEIKAIFA